MNLAIAKNPAVKLTRAAGINIAIGLFCGVLIAAIWTYTLGHERSERAQTIEQEFKENSNLALAFEEHTNKVLKGAEQTLRLIAHEYARQGARLEVQKMIDGGLIDADVLSFVGVMDDHARLILGSPDFKPIDVADREYYQFHLQHDTAEMHIGKPILGRVRNKWVVPLTRRINRANGSFAGVAYASLDTAYFNRLFEQTDLGEQGAAMLVGRDGVSRARRAGAINSTGQDMRDSSLFEHQAKQPVGNYVSAGRLEGVVRYISYRTMTTYPLIVAIGTSQPETLAAFHAKERIDYAIAALTSALITLFGSGLIYFLSRQKRAFEALSSSNARFGVAFNQGAMGVAMTDLAGRFVEVNSAFCRMLGYTSDELAGLRFLDITHPDDRDISVNNARRSLGEHGEAPLLEKRYLRKDGSTVWVAIAVSVIRGSAGEPQSYMAVAQNITEHKRAELVLADDARRFRALIENAADAVLIVDRSGLIKYGSPAVKAMGGHDLEEVVGHNFLEFIHPDEAADSRAVFEELRRDASRPRTAERRFRHKDGSWIVLETIAKNALDDPTIQGIVINARDITSRKHAEQALLKVNRALKAISACNNILIRAANEMTLVQSMCDNIVEVGGYLLAWVGEVDHDVDKIVRPIAYAGYEQGYIENAQITWADDALGSGPVGNAIRMQKIQVVQDVHADPAFRPWQANAVKLGYGSLAAFPLISVEEVIGVLTIYSAGTYAFDEAEIRMLGELADDLAFGIVTLRTRLAHEQSENRLLKSMEGTILAMAATLEMRDAYTAGHQRRVAELAVAIAHEMGIPEDDIHGLHLAAVIHDLGKIQIPAEILSKPTRLSRIEYELIKTHPEAGYNILKDVEFPWPIAQMVYQHHERLDGSGYPRGLKGTEIILGARILAVADTVEAMASHRPYRAGLGIDKALEEIGKNRGAIYDAEVVDACALLFHEKRFAFQS